MINYKIIRKSTIKRKTSKRILRQKLILMEQEFITLKRHYLLLICLEQLAKHSGVDIIINCKGDIEIDAHHTLEDVGLDNWSSI